MQLAEKEALITSIGSFIAKTIAEHTAPLVARIAELEARKPERGEKGDRGDDGNSIEIEDVLPLIESEAKKIIANIELPKPERGEKGEPGEKGDKGEQGEKGDTGEAGTQGEKGERGDPGEPGKEGAAGEQGHAGANGADGVGLAGAVISREGSLVVTLTDGKAIDLGPVVGKDGTPGLDGKDGSDGRDGLGFDDLEIVHDGLRHFAFRMKRGDLIKEFTFDVPVMIYAGIFKEGNEYKYGDTVTWGGSLWHCDLDTTDKPGGGSPWTLVAKHGRDGRNGERGEKGEKGDKGVPGQDFTMAIAGR